MGIYESYVRTCAELGLEAEEAWLGVEVEKHCLGIYKGGTLEKEYEVSTGRGGINNREGSFGTPLGLHRVRELIGEGEVEGMVFEGRKAVGKCYREYVNLERDNKITSRILRLEGMEDGLNRGGIVDSFERMIYVHGTDKEALVGVKPFTHGCIGMRNRDVIELYAAAHKGMLLYIAK